LSPKPLQAMALSIKFKAAERLFCFFKESSIRAQSFLNVSDGIWLLSLSLIFTIQSMLDYSILILEKVSFDSNIFSKELKKAIKILLPSEIEQLEIWFFNFSKNRTELKEFKIYFNS
jgi:hypothetical protein